MVCDEISLKQSIAIARMIKNYAERYKSKDIKKE
jgi:hypothetical protein